MPLRVIDLFSGAGGFTLGFQLYSLEQQRDVFDFVWANDFNEPAVETYNFNFGEHCVLGDIIDILNSRNFRLPAADIVIGGPPCQGFSPLNKNKALDPRKHMWIPYMDAVVQSGAQVFVMENVPELLASQEYQLIEQKAAELGFQLTKAKLVAADYGVPQVRTRAFIIGSRFGSIGDLFPSLRTHFDPRKIEKFTKERDLYITEPQPWVSVRQAIGDLPEPIGTEIRGIRGTESLHFGRNPTDLSIKRYQVIAQEGMNRFDLQRIAPELTPDCWIRKKSGGTDLFGRLWWDRPSVTIRTEFFKPEKGRYLHPVQHRPITHREAARLQSFPDNFAFCGNKTEIAKQIGNAVAPLLAKKIAEVVSLHFDANAPQQLQVRRQAQVNLEI